MLKNTFTVEELSSHQGGKDLKPGGVVIFQSLCATWPGGVCCTGEQRKGRPECAVPAESAVPAEFGFRR